MYHLSLTSSAKPGYKFDDVCVSPFKDIKELLLAARKTTMRDRRKKKKAKMTSFPASGIEP